MTSALPDHLPKTSGKDGLDASSLLSVYVVLLIAIPSKLVVGPLGGAGTPAQLVGVLGALWYVWYRIQRPTAVATSHQPVRAAMGLFVAAVLVSYVGAMIRPINDAEISTADLGLVSLIGWAGIVLVANDGIPNLDRLYTLLRRLVAMGGALATLGIVQFITAQPLTDYIQIPGLTINQALSGISARDGFNRPAGTAVHPIEFGVVLTTILPIALTCGMLMKNRNWIRRWYPTIAIAIAIPLSISRTAIVGTAVCLAIMVPTWPKRSRTVSLVAIASLLTVLFVALPGFLGTIAGMFTGIGTDTSAQSRTGALGIAVEFIDRSPVVGRGFSTFLPSYWILDNQYLGLLIEVGIVGSAAMLWLLASGIATAFRARRISDDPVARQMGQSLVAAVSCGAVSMALYDLLGFPMSSGLLFLVLGLSGALWRLSRENGLGSRSF